MDAYLGEVRMFSRAVPPANWVVCDGSLLQVSAYTALFSLLGTTFGGDGRVTFGIPDLRGRIPIGVGNGTNLTPRTLGNSGGTETVTLVGANLPAHTHAFNASTTQATTLTPYNNVLANVDGVTVQTSNTPPIVPLQIYQAPPLSGNFALNSASITPPPSSGAPHNNMMPSFCVSFIMCTAGIYPQPAN